VLDDCFLIQLRHVRPFPAAKTNAKHPHKKKTSIPSFLTYLM
jgi:hypothetical protein